MTAHTDIETDDTAAVGYIDIDDFKEINDTHGHAFGDDVIDEVSEIGIDFLSGDGEFRREYDQGDEFVVVLPGYDKSAAENLLDEFRETISETDPNGIEVNLSVGIAALPADGEDSETVINRSEEAMRRAKQWGGDQIQVYGEFEPLETVEVMFDLQAAPGRPDDQMVIETWREGAQADIRAEVIRNESTGARYESETANTVTSESYAEEEIRSVVSSIQSVNRRGVKFTVHIRERRFEELLDN